MKITTRNRRKLLIVYEKFTNTLNKEKTNNKNFSTISKKIECAL